MNTSPTRDLNREDELAETRSRVQAGIEQAQRGELVEGEEAVARVERRAATKRMRVEAGVQPIASGRQGQA